MTSPLWLYYSWLFSAGIGFPIHTALSPHCYCCPPNSELRRLGTVVPAVIVAVWVAEAEESLEHWTVQWDLSQKSRDKTQVTLGSISSILSQTGSLCSAVISARPEFALSHGSVLHIVGGVGSGCLGSMLWSRLSLLKGQILLLIGLSSLETFTDEWSFGWYKKH